ncbi:hypothetical protein UP06_18815 [Bradyrhizobium sp. LTSP857]|nr:hypothetical protein UP06_18815 [Bradyrhizobium sp. LTSP857]
MFFGVVMVFVTDCADMKLLSIYKAINFPFFADQARFNQNLFEWFEPPNEEVRAGSFRKLF